MKRGDMLLSIAVAALLVLGVAIPAHAEGMKQTTSGKHSRDVLFEPVWDQGVPKFKVSMLEPGTNTTPKHTYYNFQILQNSKVVYDAAEESNPGLGYIHVTSDAPTQTFVPKSLQNGAYDVKVHISATDFDVIASHTDEDAIFPITVTPEFPVGAMGAVAAVMAGAVAVFRIKRF